MTKNEMVQGEKCLDPVKESWQRGPHSKSISRLVLSRCLLCHHGIEGRSDPGTEVSFSFSIVRLGMGIRNSSGQ